MKQVIGHRGAAGLGLENSRAAIKKGLAQGAFALEIDVRQTRDKKLVVCHDADLKTMANDDRKVSNLDWAELKKLHLRDGGRLLLLEEALQLAGLQPMIVEMKESGTEDALLAVLDSFPKTPVSIASFKRGLLLELRRLRPELPLYILEHHNPLDAIQFAKRHQLQGLGLNFWLLSPLTYHFARRAGIHLYVYTINSRFLAWFVRLLYPQATICTNHPERFK